MRFDDSLRLANLRRREADVHGQVYARSEPEFGLAIRVGDMHVYPGFFAREEEQAELPVADDGWCHRETVAVQSESGLARRSMNQPAAARSARRGVHRARMAARLRAYSTTRSARSSSACGGLRPSARAVARLSTRSNRVGCCTGRSRGFAPSRIRTA